MESREVFGRCVNVVDVADDGTSVIEVELPRTRKAITVGTDIKEDPDKFTWQPMDVGVHGKVYHLKRAHMQKVTCSDEGHYCVFYERTGNAVREVIRVPRGQYSIVYPDRYFG